MKQQYFIGLVFCIALFSNCSNQIASQDMNIGSQQISLKNKIASKQFTFVAETAIPVRGGNRMLSSPYDVQVNGDTLTSYLPYFGRSNSTSIDPSDAGIKFMSTRFSYLVSRPKNNQWDILIKPQDFSSVSQFYLTIFSNGVASLNVNSNNRDPISFQGHIK
ncbi:MAG: DUF4251 domain-containing protein [Ferruginibacter sp.]